MRLDPLTLKKLQRFRQIKRGYYAFILLSTLLVLSLFAELLVNSRALLVHYQGQYYFPTYGSVISGDTFGLDYRYETNYRELQKIFAAQDSDNYVIMPLVPYNALEQDYIDGEYPPYPPSLQSQHYLGTDTMGRDIIARLVYGFRIAIGFALLVMFASFSIGITVGMLQGFYGGVFDIITQRLIEIWGMIPFLYVIMIVVSMVKPNFTLFVVINVLFGWMYMTYQMRALTYKEKSREYVLAAQALGASTRRIIFSHILPNTIIIIVTVAPFAITANISTLTALDYLGFGLRPPTPSWGELLLQGKSNLDAWWIVSSVVGAIVAVLVMVSFIGEAVREAFDPKRYTRYQ